MVFHNTGGGQPLVSDVRPLFVDASLVQPRLQFNFGFATDESFVPNSILDSFTVTIQSSNQLYTAVYLTADASGVVWAPATPGALVIDPATIDFQAIAYPSLQPVLVLQRAFQVSALIPSQFLGSSINVYFDLFDNLNPRASQAWFSDLRVTAAPGPQAWMLAAGRSIMLELWPIAKERTRAANWASSCACAPAFNGNRQTDLRPSGGKSHVGGRH